MSPSCQACTTPLPAEAVSRILLCKPTFWKTDIRGDFAFFCKPRLLVRCRGHKNRNLTIESGVVELVRWSHKARGIRANADGPTAGGDSVRVVSHVAQCL